MVGFFTLQVLAGNILGVDSCNLSQTDPLYRPANFIQNAVIVSIFLSNKMVQKYEHLILIIDQLIFSYTYFREPLVKGKAKYGWPPH